MFVSSFHSRLFSSSNQKREKLRQRNEKAEAIKNSVLAERRADDNAFIEWENTGGAEGKEEEGEEEGEDLLGGGDAERERKRRGEENDVFGEIYSSTQMRRRDLLVEMT